VKMVALGDVADINPKAEKVAPDEEVSFVGMADLDIASALTQSTTVRPFREVSKGYTTFADGDILVAKITPCFENNKIGQAQLSCKIGVGSTEFHVVRPSERLHDRYLLHFLRQDRVRRAGERRMTGSAGQRRVPVNFVEGLRVPLPSLDEQRRIAAILDSAGALRTQNLSVMAKVGGLEQATFVEMFGDPISNPHGYPVERLGDVGKLDRGVSKHRPRNDPALLGGPYPLIQTGDVARAGGTISTYNSTYSELGLAQSKLWPAGTLCITIAANIAQTGVLEFDACFPDSVVGFTADEATTTYVRTWLTFLQATLEAAAPQSAQRNINLAILRDLPIPLPPVADREHFRGCLRAMQETRAVVVRRGQQLDGVFFSLQSRAFSGQL